MTTSEPDRVVSVGEQCSPARCEPSVILECAATGDVALTATLHEKIGTCVRTKGPSGSWYKAN